MEDSKYRLVYFDVRGLAEPMRMMFAYTGTPYMDERLPWDYAIWFETTKKKFASTCGQVPVLFIGEKELSKAQVISRYLANEFGLVGDNNWDNARVDEVVGMVYDLFDFWRNTMWEPNPERKIEMKTKWLDDKFKMAYARWVKILEEKPGPFVLGDKITHADFWLANFISMVDNPFTGDRPLMTEQYPDPTEDDIRIGMTKDYPALRKHLEAVEAIPQIKEWIAKRHETIL